VTWAAALFVAATFLALLGLARAPKYASEAFARTKQAVAAVRDPALGERDKERLLRTSAGRLAVLFGTLIVMGAVAAAIPLGIVALLGALSIVDFAAVVDTTMSWEFLLVASALALAASLVRRKGRA
jgi:hypothetical protein